MKSYFHHLPGVSLEWCSVVGLDTISTPPWRIKFEGPIFSFLNLQKVSHTTPMNRCAHYSFNLPCRFVLSTRAGVGLEWLTLAAAKGGECCWKWLRVVRLSLNQQRNYFFLNHETYMCFLAGFGGAILNRIDVLFTCPLNIIFRF